MSSHSAPLDRRAWLTLAGGACFIPIEIGNRIFISSFVVSASSQISSLGMYHLAGVSGLALAFLLAGGPCKRGRMLAVFRLGFVLGLGFFVLAGLLREDLIAALVPAGLLLGLGVGSFWLAYHLYRMNIVSQQARLTLLSRSGAIINLENLIFPVFFGWMISLQDSYLPFFAFCALLLLLGFFLSRKMEECRSPWMEPYDLSGFVKKAWADIRLRRLYPVGAIVGFGLWGALDVMVPLFVYLNTGSELQLGIYASLFPLLGIGAAWLTRRIPERRYHQAAGLAAGMIVLAALLFLYLGGLSGALVFYGLFSCSAPVLAIIYALHVYNVIDIKPELAGFIPEHFVVHDLMLYIGRIPSFCLLLLISGTGVDSSLLQAVFLVLALSVIPLALMLSRVSLEGARPSGRMEKQL